MIAADLEKARAVPEHEGSLHLIVDHQRFHLEAELRWLDQVMAQFKRKAK